MMRGIKTLSSTQLEPVATERLVTKSEPGAVATGPIFLIRPRL